MKKLAIIFPLIGWMISACDRQLDLSPEDTLVDREVFRNELATEQALADAYMRLFRAATGNIAYTIGDFTTGNVSHSIFYDTYEDGGVDPADADIQAVWQNYYVAINVANNIIDKIPRFAGYAAERQAQFIAEARFIRAIAYLDLLKLYGDGALRGNMDGPGVPLQLTAFEGYDTGAIIPRSTNGEVFAQILADLTDQINDLPEQYASDLNTRARATRGNAMAYRARTLLYMHRYGDAAAAAATVLEAVPARYQLAADVWSVFPPNSDGTAKTLSSEYLFAFPISHITSSSTSINNNLANGYFFKRSWWIPQLFVDFHQVDDRRRTRLMFKGDSVYNPDMFGVLTTFKFNNSNGRDNVSMLRLPEVILTRAEALVREYDAVVADAVTLLNQVRSRAIPGAIPYTAADFENAEALRAAILAERRKELAFEGHHRYDRIRNGQPPRDHGLPEAKWVLPIPQREINVSKGVIQQNEGYRQ